MLAPAPGAGARAAEPASIAEDVPAVAAPRRLDLEPFSGSAQRAGEVLEMRDDLLLRQVHERGQLVRSMGRGGEPPADRLSRRLGGGGSLIARHAIFLPRQPSSRT